MPLVVVREILNPATHELFPDRSTAGDCVLQPRGPLILHEPTDRFGSFNSPREGPP
jgi:hypothetical protein